jgi:hypothetical protein
MTVIEYVSIAIAVAGTAVRIALLFPRASKQVA